jgi:hypothetical protein
MPLSFPTSPSLNQAYVVGSKTWVWNGYAWDLQTSNGAYILAQTGDATIKAQAAFDRANTGVAAPVQIDDLSFQFDGSKKDFVLRTDGTAISPSNPNNLQIFVGGIQIFPTKYAYDYFNLPEVSVFNSGFKITGNTISFATPPSKNMNFYGLARSEISSSFIYKQVPFTALNIMLGS